MSKVLTLMIGPTDKFCYVSPSRGIEYTDYQFHVVKYGDRETEIRDPQTGGTKSFYNAHLYVTMDQRKLSKAAKIHEAQNIGRNVRQSKKR